MDAIIDASHITADQASQTQHYQIRHSTTKYDTALPMSTQHSSVRVCVKSVPSLLASLLPFASSLVDVCDDVMM